MKTHQHFLNTVVFLIIWSHTHLLRSIATNSTKTSIESKLNKSVHLFRPRKSTYQLKCSFELPGVAVNSTQIEWLKYEPQNSQLVQKIYNEDVKTSGQSSEVNLSPNENSTVYLCRVKEPLLNESLFNKQYVQEVHMNDFIEFKNSLSLIHFDLNYSIIHLTSQRAVIELKSLEANYFSDNNDFKIVYNLIK